MRLGGGWNWPRMTTNGELRYYRCWTFWFCYHRVCSCQTSVKNTNKGLKCSLHEGNNNTIYSRAKFVEKRHGSLSKDCIIWIELHSDEVCRSCGLEFSSQASRKISEPIRGCIQKFPDWPPGARTANGTALCHYMQLYRYFVSHSSEFSAITLCVASQRVFIVVVYFVIDPVRKLMDTPS
jgi:hypothetical protein